jgi:hypothetical protein
MMYILCNASATCFPKKKKHLSRLVAVTYAVVPHLRSAVAFMPASQEHEVAYVHMNICFCSPFTCTNQKQNVTQTGPYGQEEVGQG